ATAADAVAVGKAARGGGERRAAGPRDQPGGAEAPLEPVGGPRAAVARAHGRAAQGGDEDIAARGVSEVGAGAAAAVPPPASVATSVKWPFPSLRHSRLGVWSSATKRSGWPSSL